MIVTFSLMMRRLHLVFVAVLLAGGCASLYGAASSSVSGTVRDSAGTPQAGAVVELLRSDLSILAAVYTDERGHYTIPSVPSGSYSLKAMGVSYLPSLRENLKVKTAVVVNLTLNTLYEVMQWLPSQPRTVGTQKDDWAWTLRSAANRPLLRWLEDGPLIVVSEGSGTTPRLKARLMAAGQDGAFGESGERISASIEQTPSNSRELLARVDFAPNSDGAIESMLGFRQDLGYVGSVQSVAAMEIHPDIAAAGNEGIDEAAIHTWQTLTLGDMMDAEVGSTQVIAHFAQGNSRIATAALPHATIGWRKGDSTVRYQMTTLVPSRRRVDDTNAAKWLPALAFHDGNLAIEHGLHQQLGWERHTDRSALQFAVYGDTVRNPVVEAMTRFDAAQDLAALYDSASGLIRATAPNYASAGVIATFERQLPGKNIIRLGYANGNAMVLPAQQGTAVPLTQLMAYAHSRRAQTYSVSFSGTLEGTGTQWHASYRWQPEDTVTPVAIFTAGAIEPYLNLHLRQPLHRRGEGAYEIEALLDVRNLLAQGYRPYLMPDGSVLVFAQNQRGIQTGLAFTF